MPQKNVCGVITFIYNSQSWKNEIIYCLGMHTYMEKSSRKIIAKVKIKVISREDEEGYFWKVSNAGGGCYEGIFIL